MFLHDPPSGMCSSLDEGRHNHPFIDALDLFWSPAAVTTEAHRQCAALAAVVPSVYHGASM